MDKEIEGFAKIIWDYHHMNHKLVCADCIFVLGSHDTRVAERGAELYLEGLAHFMLISGGLGKITKHIWEMTEAEKFAEIACDMGVPRDKMLLETSSTNTGENFLFSRDLLIEKNIEVNTIIAVNKPYMERRTYAKLRQFWPQNEIMVTSPQIEFKEYLEVYSKGEITKDDIISLMVGDLQRIKVYAEKGYQIHQDIPENVWDAYGKLVEIGYTKHLLK